MDFNEGVGVLVEAINKFEADIESETYEMALEKCREHLRQNFVQIFAQQTSSEGVEWPEPSPGPERLWGPHPLLVLSGDLFQQLTETAEVGERSVIAGTDLYYAEWNNNPSPDSNLPQREFMYLTEETLDACVEAIGDRLFEIMPGEVV